MNLDALKKIHIERNKKYYHTLLDVISRTDKLNEYLALAWARDELAERYEYLKEEQNEKD